MRSTAQCSFPGCTNPIDSKGLCNSHRRQQRKGLPLQPLREKGALSERTLKAHAAAQPVDGICDACEEVWVLRRLGMTWLDVEERAGFTKESLLDHMRSEHYQHP
jgi:hypothetical protein